MTIISKFLLLSHATLIALALLTFITTAQEDGNNGVTLVIDSGSGFLKAGIAGDNSPTAIIPNVLGKPKQSLSDKGVYGVDAKEYYVGSEALAKAPNLTLTWPMPHGLVENFDVMNLVLHHTFFDELRRDPEEHIVLLTEGVLNSKAAREQMVSSLFDTFEVPALAIGTRSVLALYAGGRTTGLVLQSGAGVTSSTPIYGGHSLPSATNRMVIAGDDVTTTLMGLLQQQGITIHDRQIADSIKENLCYIALDYDAELRKWNTEEGSEEIRRTYKLPDGTVISLGKERFEAAEILFQPNLAGFASTSVAQMVASSISKSDIDVREELAKNIVLAGGNTMLPNFQERLELEVAALISPINAKVISPPERKIATWVGGSTLATLSTVENSIVITRDEYKESGPSIIHRKVF